MEIAEKVRRILIIEIQRVLGGCDSGSYDLNGGDIGQALIMNRLILLEIGWILTNIATLDSKVITVMLREDGGLTSG